MKIRFISKVIFASLLLLSMTFASFAQTMTKMPKGVKKITTVEGITEYRLDNGLKFCFFLTTQSRQLRLT